MLVYTIENQQTSEIEVKEIESIYWKGKEIVAQYAADESGFHLIWEKATSCFGRGYWSDSLPWKNEVGWKNTP